MENNCTVRHTGYLTSFTYIFVYIQMSSFKHSDTGLCYSRFYHRQPTRPILTSKQSKYALGYSPTQCPSEASSGYYPITQKSNSIISKNNSQQTQLTSEPSIYQSQRPALVPYDSFSSVDDSDDSLLTGVEEIGKNPSVIPSMYAINGPPTENCHTCYSKPSRIHSTPSRRRSPRSLGRGPNSKGNQVSFNKITKHIIIPVALPSESSDDCTTSKATSMSTSEEHESDADEKQQFSTVDTASESAIQSTTVDYSSNSQSDSASSSNTHSIHTQKQTQRRNPSESTVSDCITPDTSKLKRIADELMAIQARLQNTAEVTDSDVTTCSEIENDDSCGSSLRTSGSELTQSTHKGDLTDQTSAVTSFVTTTQTATSYSSEGSEETDDVTSSKYLATSSVESVSLSTELSSASSCESTASSGDSSEATSSASKSEMTSAYCSTCVSVSSTKDSKIFDSTNTTESGDSSTEPDDMNRRSSTRIRGGSSKERKVACGGPESISDDSVKLTPEQESMAVQIETMMKNFEKELQHKNRSMPAGPIYSNDILMPHDSPISNLESSEIEVITNDVYQPTPNINQQQTRQNAFISRTNTRGTRNTGHIHQMNTNQPFSRYQSNIPITTRYSSPSYAYGSQPNVNRGTIRPTMFNNRSMRYHPSPPVTNRPTGYSMSSQSQYSQIKGGESNTSHCSTVSSGVVRMNRTAMLRLKALKK